RPRHIGLERQPIRTSLEEGDPRVSQQAPHESTSAPETFGGNRWLIEELYSRYKKDKSPVDPPWWEVFETYRPPDGSGQSTNAPADTPAPAQPSQASTARPPQPQPPPAAATQSSQTPSTTQPEQEPASPGTQTSGATAAQDRDTTPAPADMSVDLPPEAPEAAAVAPTAAYTQAVTGGGPRSAGGEGEATRLKGPAGRVVKNMETSREVPTATSVRTIPAKLLVDNRIVLNNHLKRSRGGKVSFTHLIGFAVVEALGDMPETHAAYQEVDGEPGILRPAHVNSARAIGLAKPARTRHLFVPSIKGGEELAFAEFWQAYEDIIRKARDNNLTANDFAGTTISLT